VTATPTPAGPRSWTTRLRERIAPYIAPTLAAPGYWSRLAAMVAPGDWVYRDAQYLVAEVELDPAAAARWIPRPLRLAEPARAQVFTAFFPDNSFGSVYREAGVFIDVVHRGTRAIYSPWMLVDDDVALILGRELLGYPKKLGELTWDHDGDRIRGIARRRGHDLIAMEGTLGDRIAAPPPILGRPHRNIRSTAGIAIPKLIAFTPRERVIEVREAHLEVRIGGSERDPLHEMGFGRVLRARLHRVDLGGSRPPIPIAAVSPLAFARYLLLRSH
jgi:acetoacetate decarboxylase